MRSISFGEAKEMIARGGGFAYGDAPTDRDRSFMVVRNDEIIGVVPAFFINGTACFHDETSIVPFYCDEQSVGLVNGAITEWSHELLDSGAVRSIKLLADEGLEGQLVGRGLVVDDNTRLYGFFDLRKDEATLWQSIRKRYRSRINAGERSLTRAVYEDKDAVDPAVVEFLTASDKTTYNYDRGRVDEHLNKMISGQSTLMGYWFEGRVVGAVGFAAWQKFTAKGDHFYELGAYDHSCPVPTHYCMYDALRHYRRSGLGDRAFLLHGVPPERPDGQEKMANIDHFKLGYCSDTFTRPYKVVRRTLT